MKHNHFEMVRMKLLRNMDQNKMFAIWRIDAPWQPITKKVWYTILSFTMFKNMWNNF